MRGSENMRKTVFAILLFTLPIVAGGKGTGPVYAVNCDDPKSYACNQYLRLELKQQKTLQSYAAYQADLAALNAEAETIKKENNWPAGVRFDGANLTFSAPPAAAPAPQGKP